MENLYDTISNLQAGNAAYYPTHRQAAKPCNQVEIKINLMKQIQILIVLTVFILVSVENSSGQNNNKISQADKGETLSNKLVGTWQLIEFADLDSVTGKWEYPFGKNPRGYFTYTKNNIVNLNISSDQPLIISEDSARNYNIKLLNWLDHNSEGYFGTYSVDINKSVVTHHVKGGSIPWYIDTDQPRPFIMKGDTLIIGDNKTWKRVLVKTD